jgi:exopolysaccharide biosynthesis WecB/TagA/CpsF family protein
VSLDARQDRVGGVTFDALASAETVQAVLQGLRAGRGGWVAAPAIASRQRPALNSCHNLVHAVTSMVGAARAVLQTERPIDPPREGWTAAASLVSDLTAGAAREGHRVFLLGTATRVWDVAALRLNQQHPRHEVVVDAYSPPTGFEHSERELVRIRERLRQADPAMVVCSLDLRQQEVLIRDLVHEFTDVWFIGCEGVTDIGVHRVGHHELLDDGIRFGVHPFAPA